MNYSRKGDVNLETLAYREQRITFNDNENLLMYRAQWINCRLNYAKMKKKYGHHILTDIFNNITQYLEMLNSKLIH